jgi:hypothetical protein
MALGRFPLTGPLWTEHPIAKTASIEMLGPLSRRSTSNSLGGAASFEQEERCGESPARLLVCQQPSGQRADRHMPGSIGAGSGSWSQLILVHRLPRGTAPSYD